MPARACMGNAHWHAQAVASRAYEGISRCPDMCCMSTESNGKQERKHEAQLTILPVQHSKVSTPFPIASSRSDALYAGSIIQLWTKEVAMYVQPLPEM